LCSTPNPDPCSRACKQDLASFRKIRNKAVSASAKGLIGLFREIAPGMLEKKDRGRGVDLDARPEEYGAAKIRDRIEVCQIGSEFPVLHAK
jgi:protein SDA1